MVGDEDQSIYGFRGAYPRALLNFRYDYINPYILRMERNYRSTAQIVDFAQGFISKNQGRYTKTMLAERGLGEPVKLLKCSTRLDQYKALLEVAKRNSGDAAFLFRDNDSSVCLVDLFLRNAVPYRLKKPEISFCKIKVVQQMIAYLKLTVDQFDWSALKLVCNTGILYLKKQQLDYAIKSIQHGSNVFEALNGQMKYVEYRYRDRAEMFRTFILDISQLPPLAAIDRIMESGFGSYLSEHEYGTSQIEVLQFLASYESSISSFLSRLDHLESVFSNDVQSNDNNVVSLSTIHSSKGLEYDNVYLVDVYDGKFPSSKANHFSRSKDEYNGEQEERRLMYVGMTRAKNKLTLFSIANKHSTYIDELFPEIENERREIEKARLRKELEKRQRKEAEHAELRRREAEARRIADEQRRKEDEEKRKAEIEAKRYADRKKIALLTIDRSDIPSYDHLCIRWARCLICGEPKPVSDFESFDNGHGVNRGICKDCGNKG